MAVSIVIIEDDIDILDLIKFILEDEHYKVFAYRTIVDIATILSINPALILLDDRLAEGYGSSLCLSIKTDERTKHVPVVLVSASPDLEKVAKKCRADGIIPKPFELDHLVNMVSEYSRSSHGASSFD